MIKIWVRFWRFLACTVLVAVLLVSPGQALAGSDASSLPTRLVQGGKGKAAVNTLMPEWSQISFGSLSPIQSSGTVDTRTWTAGQTPDQFLTLGDISPALSVELLPVGTVLQQPGVDSSQVVLSSFPLVGEQTLNQLVEAVPDLGHTRMARKFWVLELA